MRWCLVLLCIAAHLHASPPQKIRAIIACDTTPKLRYSINHDFEDMQDFLKSLSSDIKIPLSMTTLHGPGLTIHNFMHWIKELPQSSNDVVVVYYSGHGMRFANMKSPWPCLGFLQTKEILPIDSIIKALSKKQHRLVILLFDCCNSPLRENPIHSMEPKSLHGPSLSWEGIRKLFLEEKGAILAVAASPGKPAFAMKQGGLFTKSLLISLEHENLQKEVSWHSVFQKTIARCGNAQKPIAVIRKNPQNLIEHKAKKDHIEHVHFQE